jgi:hypothetical protein
VRTSVDGGIGSGSGSGGNLKSDRGGNWNRNDDPDMLRGQMKNCEKKGGRVGGRFKRCRCGEKNRDCGGATHAI